MRKFTIVCLLSVGLSSCSSGIENPSTTDADRTVATNSTDKAYIELETDITYEWSIRTNSENGQGEWSDALEFTMKSSEEEAMAELSAEASMSEYFPNVFDDGVNAVPGVETLSPIGPVVGVNPVFLWTPVDVAISYDIRVVESDSGQTTYTENYNADDLCLSSVCQLETSRSPEESSIQSSQSTVPTVSADSTTVVTDTQAIFPQLFTGQITQPDLAAAATTDPTNNVEGFVEQAPVEQVSAEQVAAEQAAAEQALAQQAAEYAAAEQAAAQQTAEHAAAEQATAEQTADQAVAEQATAQQTSDQAAAEQAAAELAAEQAAEEQAAAELAAEEQATEQAAAELAAAELATEQAAAEQEAAELAAEQAAAELVAAEQAAEQATAAELAAAELAAEQAAAALAAEQAAAELAAEQAAAELAAEQTAAETPVQEQAQTSLSVIDPEIEALQASEGVLAFPGAIGYARDTTGGRGGRIVTVNTVENIVNPNDQFISLREALSVESGPRTIVFSVGGVFDLGSERVNMLGEDDSYITVACQTAPSPGVVMKTWGITLGQRAHDIIFRHCVLRGDDDLGPGQSQASRSLTVPGGSYNVMLDHMSISWYTDENFTSYVDSSQTEGSRNITVSNSIVSEGDADSKHPLSAQNPQWGYHSMGPSCINNNNNVRPLSCSIVNNFIAHNASRNGIIWGGTGEVSNNIVYNWFMFGVSAKSFHNKVDAHLHNNLMKAGPQTTTGTTSNASCGPAQYKCALALGPSDSHGTASYTTSSNYYVDNGNSIADAELINNPLATTSQTPSFSRATQSTTDIRDMAMPGSDHLRCVGASKPTRDAIDARVIQEFHDGTGAVGIGSNNRSGGHNVNVQRTWNIYSESAHPAGYDSDDDGMPDEWEVQYGLDPLNPNDHAGDLDGDGYTNIEEYLAIAAAC